MWVIFTCISKQVGTIRCPYAPIHTNKLLNAYFSDQAQWLIICVDDNYL
jgi:hypothetical protein